MGSAKKYHFSQNKMNKELEQKISANDELGDMVDYLPNAPLQSKLINYEQYAQFWRMVPSYVRIRIPQHIFRASEDGYNLRNLYTACERYSDSYYMCLILIKTQKDVVLGTFIDTIPQCLPKSEY